MAKRPTKYEITQNKIVTNRELVKKQIAQEKLGKTFINTGAGVIPESQWIAFKKSKLESEVNDERR